MAVNQKATKKKEAEASPASDALRAVPFPAFIHCRQLSVFHSLCKIHVIE
jgi:hypothetical protein